MFTDEERTLLQSNDWSIINCGVAEKGYYRITKVYEGDFEVESYMEDDQGMWGFYEFDSNWASLESAMKRA